MKELVESACRAIVGLQVPRAASLDGRITLSEAAVSSLDGTLQCAQKCAMSRSLRSLCKENEFKLLVAGSIAVTAPECLPGKGRLTQERVAIIHLSQAPANMTLLEGRIRVYRKF
jgi:hypothetical protein